jgi:ABC-type nitrate/sulfonate/bicarbonate transport system substrate-binding protein
VSPSWQWVKANPDEAARKIRELGRENLALREALDSLRMKIAEAATGDCRKLHDFERIALAMKEAQP